MPKFDKILLAVDFDDTLRPEGYNEVPKRNIQAIEYFISNGGSFTVATGRDLRSFQSIKHLFPIHIPAVVSNGAAMYDKDTDKVIYECSLPESSASDIAMIMDAFPEYGVEIHKGFTIYVPRCNVGVVEHLQRMKASPLEIDLMDIPHPCTKFAFFSNTIKKEDARTHELCQFILDTFPGVYEPVVSSGIVDVAPVGITKASGVKKLTEMLNIPFENLYCAGDSWNDLPMLELAREGFIPKSANPGIFGHGMTVVCDVKDGAIGDIIEILDKRY